MMKIWNYLLFLLVFTSYAGFDLSPANPQNAIGLNTAARTVKLNIIQTDIGPAWQLNGEQLISVKHDYTSAQTIRVLVKYPEAPTGLLISRSRAEEGMRGFQLGFSTGNPYDFTGRKIAMNISDGSRARSTTVTGEEFSGTGWMEYILRFQPGSELILDIFAHSTGKHLIKSALPTPEVNQLSERAGQKILCIGGGRYNNSQCRFFAPNGTLIAGITLNNFYESDAKLEEQLKVKFPPVPGSIKPVKRYVDNLGNNGNDGLSLKTPYKTIQRAAEETNPGDTVYIAPGVYFENVRLRRGGLAEMPITFKATGEVILTMANRPIREGKIEWKLEDHEYKIYSTALDYQPSRILYDDTDLFAGFIDLEGMRNFTLRDGYPAPARGYTYDPAKKRLYVRFHASDNPDPAKYTIAVSPPFAPGANGHHVGVPEHANFYIDAGQEAHVILDGLTFETPGSTGVLTKSGNVVIRNSYFKGCRFGVWGMRCRGVFIENCSYGQSPVYEDFLDIIERYHNTGIKEKFRFYFWAHKGKNQDRDKFKNYETGIIAGSITDAHLRNSIIYDTFEGISTWCVSSMKQLRVYGNIFRRIVDNAVETENHAQDVRIHDNLFEDIAEAISWQPLTGKPWPGPVFVYRNVFRDTPDFALTPKAFPPGVFKLGASGQNWTYEHMGKAPVSQLSTRISKRFVAVPDPGFLVFNNTIIRPRGSLLSTPQPITGPAVRDLVNFRFFNNIIATEKFHDKPEWRGSLLEFYHNAEMKTAGNQPHRGISTAHRGFEFNRLEELGIPVNGIGKPQNAKVIGGGTLDFEEVDDSCDLGAFPHEAPPPASDWPGMVGPGKAVDLATLSPFQRKTIHMPGLLRTTGITYGTWGVYTLEKPVMVSLGVAKQQCSIIFRSAALSGNHPVIQVGKLKISMTYKQDQCHLLFSRSNENFSLQLPAMPRHQWQNLTLYFNKTDIKASLNQEVLGHINMIIPQNAEQNIIIGRNPVYDAVIL